MARPAVARIDLGAIRHNYQLAKRVSGVRAAAVIKADAYGHGAVKVARALMGEADAFAVACLEEALELCESGIRTPILLLEGVFSPDELAAADRLGMKMVLHNHRQLQWLLNARPQRAFDIFLKIDTGMHRLGFDPSEVAAVYTRLQGCAHIASITLMTHFSRADEVDEKFSTVQLQRFRDTVSQLPGAVSIANSAGILAWPDSHHLAAERSGWVRPGIMLYGADPLDQPNTDSQQLRPAMTLESELIAARDLAAGECIGYGARFQCNKPTRVGVVAIGYADGYPRHAVDGTPVFVAGKPSRIIGRVSMDMLTVDLTDLPQAAPGDRVELWGRHVLANEVAHYSDTIAYTLFTGITRRVARRYSQ